MEELNKVEGEHFDLIIANPPYGKIGANITKKIIDTIDFDEYVNIMPLIDYTKCTDGDLWHHVQVNTVMQTSGAFKDAAICPIICLLGKSSATNIYTEEQFKIACAKKSWVKKYYLANLARTKISFDERQYSMQENLNDVLILPLRVTSGNHSGKASIGYTTKSTFYCVNSNQIALATKQTIIACGMKFAPQMKTNFIKFINADISQAFIDVLLRSLNRDTMHSTEHNMWFPKVDWAREWTVEEILADYGYTEKEIKEVMCDLANFKGMD